MKIVDIKATNGPNYWSAKRHNLIVMLLNLEDLEEKPTNKIHGFYERITALIPSLHDHHCSEGQAGGFFSRVKDGTWMGHVIEHIALELQTLAGIQTGFGRTRGAGEAGLYHVVFEYGDAEAGVYAAKAAVNIAEALVKNTGCCLHKHINTIKEINNRNKLGPSTNAIVQEAVKRNIPFLRLDGDSFIQLGYGAAQSRIETTIASTTSCIGVEMAGNKQATKHLLSSAFIPVPAGITIKDQSRLQQAIEEVGYPVVIKPRNGNQGKGATTNITCYHDAVKAFNEAKKISPEVICEQFISGSDFRALVINYKFAAAALRTPACVTGNGIDTIKQLVEKVNLDPKRGTDHEKVLTQIKIDHITTTHLQQQGLGMDTVLPCGKTVYLKPTANLSTGGTATDVTNTVHPANKALFERIARIMGLDICGIDIMAPCLEEQITKNDGAILEVNAAPGLRMHLEPTVGKPRNVAEPIIDMLFPGNANGRIPIIAITGTNGKTTTTRLAAHIARQAGYMVGCTTTDGVYIGSDLIQEGDCTGPVSARAVLKDPAVTMAVLECARGGILRGGLGFDQCDVAIIMNVAEDHLGLQGIDTIEKMVRVKGVVAESVAADGYAVLNADDDNVYNMHKNIACNVALFSLDARSPRILSHIRNGGLVAVNQKGYVTIYDKGERILVGETAQIPVTFSGQASFNIANVLAAGLAAYTQGIKPAQIFASLSSFIPGPDTMPGRMNLFQFDNFKILVDYAHNPHGVKAIAGYITSIPASVKLGIITGVGDRRSEDITELGMESAKIFDEIIIRHDTDMRGRSAVELDELLREGIKKIDSRKKITIVTDETHALDVVLKTAPAGSLAVVFADDIGAVIKQLKEAQVAMRHIKPKKEVA
jgi:cyanophycin synthetase